MDDKSLKKFIFQPNLNQLRFIELYLDISQRRTMISIANELEITTQAIWKWFNDINFVEWINSKRDELLAKSLIPIYLAAIRKAISGDYNFAKLLLEIKKEYMPAISHNISIKITEIVITHVIEVINKYIEDDNLKRKIGEELIKINLN